MRALSILMAVAMLPTPAIAERTFGLVVGIDDYTYIPDLHGAVNDAEDIADALQGIGAKVTLLTDSEVTRAAFFGAWETILAEAEPGDRLIVSYAGHGSNEPEHTPGSEKDGRDENFLLAGFAPRGEAAGQRIRDDEIADLLARSEALDVIFVADACHAGTVTRDLKPTLGYRYVTPTNLERDPLPPPPPPPGGQDGYEGDVALFLAAVNETEKVPEVIIDGVPRGALSYAFADGIRGEADLDGDGVLTKGELETYVRKTVRFVSDGAQLPQSEPAGFENQSLIALPDRKAPPETPLPLIARPFDDLPPVTVATLDQWSNVTGVTKGFAATLRREGQTVYSNIGDQLATVAGDANLQAVADKHRLVAVLNRLASSRANIRFAEGDRLYRDGQDMMIEVDGREAPHLTLFNIGADGTVSLLYPLTQFGDPIAAPPGHKVSLPVRVTPPFGADHVVAIETDAPPTLLINQVTALSGTRNIPALWDILRTTEGTLTLFPFFTAGQTL